MAANRNQLGTYRASIYDLFQAHMGSLPETEKASPTKAQAQALNLM